MTNKGITKQELNNDILQELNKIDKQLAEDTQKDITEIKLKDGAQDAGLSQLKYVTNPHSVKREFKDPDTGVFTTVVLRDAETNNRVVFSNLHTKVGENFTKQTVNIYNSKDQQLIQYRFDLIYDSDGDLIERRYIK